MTTQTNQEWEKYLNSLREFKEAKTVEHIIDENCKYKVLVPLQSYDETRIDQEIERVENFLEERHYRTR